MTQTKQTVTRKGSADICHRVMHERCKCFHVHGHTYLYELTFSFSSMPEISGSYAIDFKEIKRVGCAWIDDVLDHGAMINPHDTILIDAINKLGTKLWTMSLYGKGNFCNPSAENISKEMFLAMKVLFEGRAGGLKIEHIRLYETPNCYTDCFQNSITEEEEKNFMDARRTELLQYRESKGVFDYDARTGTACAANIQN